ncbi:hypothetical protein GCM10023093_21680 [Nemorincola caseinilytica]|uniref:AAA domain-containing protein n=1 Tax=Nemorincola caseinilytica TaxID=2054315 RepID=A0ABP8NKD6_9BACT
MIRIEAIKAIIHTNNGVFGRTLPFKKGLNIVRANNTSGKSSLFGALLYGLGFEEILGSKNDKALQSVFKSIVKEIISHPIENTVVQSEIYLQFSNGSRSITSKRFILNDKIKPQAVEVFLGPLLTEPDGTYERLPMYVHDKGGASSDEVGFHKYLEDFIGAHLPEIINQEGRRVKMFLPLLASAHFIEQKAGWSDFYANMPYYGVRDAAAKVFEYILAFDVFEAAASRQEIQNRIKRISDNWTEVSMKVSALARRGGAEVVGLPHAPEILTKESKPYLRFLRAEKSFLIGELIAVLSIELKEVTAQLKTPINDNLKKIEEEIDSLKFHTDRYEILSDNISSQLSQNKETLRQYLAQQKNVDEDLRKNKDAEKLQKIGLEFDLKSNTGLCPTCNQPINDTLLHEHVEVVPMRIDENINYLQAQRKMIEAFIANIRSQIAGDENKAHALETAIQTNRAKIRALKRSLISDDRLPSEEIIERKVILERELNFVYKLREEFELLMNDLYKVASEFAAEKGAMARFSGNYLSTTDVRKLENFTNYFKALLGKFNFTSKQISNISISLERYLPVYEVPLPNGLNKQVDIRFESSASDFIRAQWAYYTALLDTSINSGGNHFETLIFDEPQQQSAATGNFKAFLSQLETYKEQQTIVLASFQNSQEDFKEATSGLTNVNIIDFAHTGELFITRIDANAPTL